MIDGDPFINQGGRRRFFGLRRTQWSANAPGGDDPTTATDGIIRRGWEFLDLDRFDVWAIVLLVLAAFVLRSLSPLPIGEQPGTIAFPYNSSGCTTQVPGYSGEACGFVFDEVYFPVDALKDLKNIDYFDPEPPLTKLVIAPSVAAFGFNPEGWRFTSDIAGSLAVGILYLIARRLRRDRFFAVVAAGALCVDGLAFVESRTGVIDMIAVAFAMFLYYTVLLHWAARTRAQWRATLYLCAIAAGLGLSAKVTALPPIAIAVALVGGRWVFPHISNSPRFMTVRARAAAVQWRSAAGRLPWVHYLLASLLVCVVFTASFSRYMTIPHSLYNFTSCTISGGIEGGTYTIPSALTKDKIGGVAIPNPVTWVAVAIDQVKAEFNYQTEECQPHPYASEWYTWPVDFHPVLFYYPGTHNPQMITNMGNPALWWLALPALLAVLFFMTARGSPWMRVATAVSLALGLLLMILPYHFAEKPPQVSVHIPTGLLFHLGLVFIFLFGLMAIWWAVGRGNFVPAFIILGFMVGWLMWAPGNADRVLFFYHMLDTLPFIALGFAYALTGLRRLHISFGSRRISLSPVAYAGAAIVVVGFLFFYPIWTGMTQTMADETLRIWLSSWLYPSY